MMMSDVFFLLFYSIKVSTVSMSPPDGVTMLSEHHHHSTAYVFGSNNGTDHMIQHESAPNPVDMMHHHPYFDNSNSELFSSSWSSPTTSSEEESGIATTAAAATVDCLQHPTTMTRDQLIGRVLELEHERRQYFTPRKCTTYQKFGDLRICTQ